MKPSHKNRLSLLAGIMATQFIRPERENPHGILYSHPSTVTPEYIAALKAKAQAKRDRKQLKKHHGI